jgi:DNA-binding transcriptional MerR regulator
MGEESFDSVLEAWDSFQNADFPISVVEEYMNDTNNDDMEDALTSMESNHNGTYDSYEDYGYEMVQDGSYNPSDYEIYVTDTHKRIVAGEEADNRVDSMDNQELLEYADLTSDYEEVEEKISDFNSEITTIEGDILVLEDEISDIESQLDDSDDDSIGVIADLIVEKKDEIESKQKMISDLEDSIATSEKELEEIIDSAKEESRSRIYDEIYTQLDKDPAEFTSELGYEKPTDATFVNADYEEIGKNLASELLAIESEDGKIYLFSNYAGGGKVLSTSKPSKKYKYFVVELKSKRVVFGSETKADADKKKNELSENIKASKFSVYKRDYAERRLMLDVDNTSAWINASDLSNAGKVAIKNIQKKSMGGWLQQQWFEADFGDGAGATKFFAKGGKVPAYWNSGENIRVFDYKTQNFDICGGAVEVFNNAVKDIVSSHSKELYEMGVRKQKDDVFSVQKSAEFLDVFFGLEKEIVSKNKAYKNQFDYALTNLLKAQIMFGLYNKFDTFKFASNHIVEMVKRLDKSELKFADGGKVIYDHEGDMAKSELQKIEKYAKYLDENIKTDTQLMAWVQSKISRMATDMGDVKHYMEYQVNNKKAMGGLVVGGIALIVGALAIYFINKNKRSIKGGNQIHTRRGWVQDQKNRSKQKHEIAYQKKK